MIGVEPATAVVSLVNPEDMTSVRSSFCNQMHYFTSTDDARPWLEDHRGATLLPVADAYRLGVALTTSVVEQLQTDMVIGTAESRGTDCCR